MLSTWSFIRGCPAHLASHTSFACATRHEHMPPSTAAYAPSDVTSDNELNDYDIISSGHRSIESSVADLDTSTHVLPVLPREILPSPLARDQFDTVGLSAEDIQGYVRRALGRERDGDSLVRVYVDCVFDVFHAG